MKRHLLPIAAFAAAFAVMVPAAFADGTPTTPTSPAPAVDTSKIQADITQLNTDIHARHAGVQADLKQIGADAQAGADAATVQADIQKLHSDFESNEAVVKTDRAQVMTDVKALVKAAAKGSERKATRDAVHTLLRDARAALRTELVQFKQENKDARSAARDAIKTDRKQHKQAGQGATAPKAGRGSLHGRTRGGTTTTTPSNP